MTGFVPLRLPRALAALVLAGLPLIMTGAACAGGYPGDYEIPSFPGDPPPVTTSAARSPLDRPIETLAADPVAARVIDRNIPGLLQNQRYHMFKSMSLRTVAALSSGRISKDALAEINQELIGK